MEARRASIGWLSLSLSLVLASACDDEPSPGRMRGSPAPDGLWVLTYNVNFERPSDETVDAIGHADADLVFLQETHPRWERAIRERWSERYPHMLFHHEAMEGGLAVLSRHPIEERAYGRAPGGAFPASCVRATTPLGDVHVLHVHLHPPLDEEGRLVTGYFTTGGSRYDEMRHHLACFDSLPDLVLGDFNEGEGEAVAHLADLGLEESQTAFPPVERTWTWDTGVTELVGRPDHVFHGPTLRVRAVQVMERGASDHRPLRVQVSR